MLDEVESVSGEARREKCWMFGLQSTFGSTSQFTP